MISDKIKTAKTFFLFFSIIIILLSSFSINPASVFAQRRLEVDYPEIEGTKPEEVTTSIPDYVKYIFNFALWISGFIALAVLIYAGFIYFTSTGNPEKLKDAKDRIVYAFLGLVILFGSYLLLISINPDLVVFRLKTLAPIISKLPPGVLACKTQPKTKSGDDAVAIAFQLANNFPHEPLWRQKEIFEELEYIFEQISKNCYTIGGKGNIKSDFDNKITDIYFIPGLEKKGTHTYLTLYGAILYEKRGFLGYTLAIYNHLEPLPGEVYTPVHRDLTQGTQGAPGSFKISEPSSIEPFKLIWEPDPSWRIWLFQKPNHNQGTGLTGIKYTLDSGRWYGQHNINDLVDKDGKTVSPESIWVEGDILGILFTKNGEGASFSAESDYNLLDNKNIRSWEWCGWGDPLNWCAVAEATKLMIINALIY